MLIKSAVIKQGENTLSLSDIKLDKQIAGLRGIRYIEIAFLANKDEITIDLSHIYSDYSNCITKTIPRIRDYIEIQNEIERAIVLYLEAVKNDKEGNDNEVAN